MVTTTVNNNVPLLPLTSSGGVHWKFPVSFYISVGQSENQINVWIYLIAVLLPLFKWQWHHCCKSGGKNVSLQTLSLEVFPVQMIVNDNSLIHILFVVLSHQHSKVSTDYLWSHPVMSYSVSTTHSYIYNIFTTTLSITEHSMLRDSVFNVFCPAELTIEHFCLLYTHFTCVPAYFQEICVEWRILWCFWIGYCVNMHLIKLSIVVLEEANSWHILVYSIIQCFFFSSFPTTCLQ